MSKWIKWRTSLLKKCHRLVKKYPNLGFLPQTTKEVTNCESWGDSFNDGMSPQEAINEEIDSAARS